MGNCYELLQYNLELSESTEMLERTNDDWVNITNDFYRKTQFPNCIGVVDGKHTRIKMPTGSGSLLLFNYKHLFLTH